MRLIDTETLQLHQYGSNLPDYAILSHRWRDGPEGEATLQRFENFVKNREIHSDGAVSAVEAGIQKVLVFCDIAKRQGYEWAWVDTVCIDKTNVVELSEALNSMFWWYQRSRMCIVYLSDVQPNAADTAFENSDWFKRGWTLQELIAPYDMTFYNSEWLVLGTKWNLKNRISSITGIPVKILDVPRHISRCCVAQRLSWAAGRRATRAEDRVYSLLGMFDVNMELLYGEGLPKAFRRLQLKILEEYEDESIFAWHMVEEVGAYVGQLAAVDSEHGTQERIAPFGLTGVLAQNLEQFSRNGKTFPSVRYSPDTPIMVSNRGIEMTRPYVSIKHIIWSQSIRGKEWNASIILIPLSCTEELSDGQVTEGSFIILVEDFHSKPVRRWCRVHVPSEWKKRLDSMATAVDHVPCQEPLWVRMSWLNKWDTVYVDDAPEGQAPLQKYPARR